MINTATELANEEDDEEIRNRLAKMFESHERQFQRALELAQEKGDISEDVDSKALARYLMMCVRGLRVYGQTRAYRPDLELLVENEVRLGKYQGPFDWFIEALDINADELSKKARGFLSL